MNPNPVAPTTGARRAAVYLVLSLSMVGGLAACEKRTTTAPDGSTTTTTTAPMPASAASR